MGAKIWFFGVTLLLRGELSFPPRSGVFSRTFNIGNMETDKNDKSSGGKKSIPKVVNNLNMLASWEALEKKLNEMEKKPFYRIRYLLEARQECSFFHNVSSLGAGLLGLGLGTLLSPWLGSFASLPIAGGMVLLGWGICMLHFNKSLWWLRLPQWLRLVIVIGYGISAAIIAWLLENIFQQ